MTKLWKLSALALALGWWLSCPSVDGGEQEVWPHYKARSTEEAHIYRQLGRITTVDLVETPLVEACEFFREQYDIPIVINSAELDIIGLDDSEPVSIRLERTSLRNMLRLLLNPLDLEYVVTRDVLLITTSEDPQIREVRGYNVASILGDAWTTESLAISLADLLPAADATTLGRVGPSRAMMGGMVANEFGGGHANASAQAGADRVTMQAAGDVIMVRATDAEHQKVAEVLRSIHDAMRNEFSAHTRLDRAATRTQESHMERTQRDPPRRPADAVDEDPFSNEGDEGPFGHGADEDPFG